MKSYSPVWLAPSLFSVALAAACGTVEVPFEPSPDGSGGSGGSGSGSGGLTSTDAGVGGGVSGGAAGASTGGQFTEDGGTGGLGGLPGVEVLLETTSRVWAVAATETDVYWTEWGTNDELDNYLFNGTLNKMGIESRTQTNVAQDLEAPMSLAITSVEAYMLLRRSRVVNSEGDRAIGRVPLVGGPVDIVASEVKWPAAPPTVVFEDYAYVGLWESSTSWKVLECASGQAPQEMAIHGGTAEGANDTYLYFSATVDDEEGLWRQPREENGEPEKVSGGGYSDIVLDGERILTTRSSGGDTYIAEIPLEGGTWANVQRIGDYAACDQLVVRGERYAARCYGSGSEGSLVTGLLGEDTDPQSFPLSDESAWAINEHYVFIAEGKALHGAALD